VNTKLNGRIPIEADGLVYFERSTEDFCTSKMIKVTVTIIDVRSNDLRAITGIIKNLANKYLATQETKFRDKVNENFHPMLRDFGFCNY
jgi:hypothetical protein